VTALNSFSILVIVNYYKMIVNLKYKDSKLYAQCCISINDRIYFKKHSCI